MNLTSEIQPARVPGCWQLVCRQPPFPSFSTCPPNQELLSGQTDPCHIIRSLQWGFAQIHAGNGKWKWVSFSFNLLKNKREMKLWKYSVSLGYDCTLWVTAEGKEKPKCTDESTAISFQILGIKLVTQCSSWKALGEGTDQAACIWAFFLSQITHVSLPTPQGLVMHCSSLSSCWNLQTEGILQPTGDWGQAPFLPLFPARLQRSSVEGHQAGTAAGCLQPRPSALPSFLLAFHIISLFKTPGNSQHYTWMIYLLIC